MSILNSAATLKYRGGPFAGLDVAGAAGLRLEPGSPRPVFDQDVWDLSGLIDAPVSMGLHRKILDFTRSTTPSGES